MTHIYIRVFRPNNTLTGFSAEPWTLFELDHCDPDYWFRIPQDHPLREEASASGGKCGQWVDIGYQAYGPIRDMFNECLQRDRPFRKRE